MTLHIKSLLPNDTHPAAEQKMLELLRQMSPAQKIQRVQSLNQTLELLALADVRSRYPDADERECFLRVASRRLPSDLMQKAYGWNPEEKGY